MLIRFQKPPAGENWSRWEADRGRRRIVRGGMGWSLSMGLTHDLAGYAVERALDLHDGFWHCVADGATFHSTDRKLTRPGRAVIVARRAGLEAHDGLTHLHWERWRRGEPTPAAATLDEVSVRWDALERGEWMSVEWNLRQRDSTRLARQSDRPHARRR